MFNINVGPYGCNSNLISWEIYPNGTRVLVDVSIDINDGELVVII